MKKINDKKLYFYFSIITLTLGLILAFTYSYSAFIVEPEIEKFLSAEENINENYQKAYIMLKDPQIFARYENYDNIARPVENIINVFDRKVENGELFEPNDKLYLHLLLERRKMGAMLTRNTFLFFVILSILGWIFYTWEVIELKKTEQAAG